VIRQAPSDSLATPRFSGVTTFFRLPHVADPSGADIAVVGFPFDTGATFRIGARFGPAAIRAMSVALRPHNSYFNVTLFDQCSAVDCGDLPTVPGAIEESYRRAAAAFLPLLRTGVIPIVLGGDHSITLAELRALAAVHGPLALVHYDAHVDTNDEYFGQKYTHGTPFRRAVEEGLLDPAHSIQLGMRGPVYSEHEWQGSRDLGFELLPWHDVRSIGLAAAADRVRARAGQAKAFFSFDVDFVDPAYAPGTGTIEVGGPTSAEALELVRRVEGLHFVGFDVVEVLPMLDPSQITASLAANVAFEFMTFVALSKRRAAAGGSDGRGGRGAGDGG
jgi:agmatinase